MAIDLPAKWFLRKHEKGEVFGPIRFDQIVSWAKEAQVNPQDMVSNDAKTWTRAPMLPGLAMDWLIELTDKLLYGPTTSEALMEFVRLGEISRDTKIVNCKTAETMELKSAPFFSEDAGENPQKRLLDLEEALAEKQRQLGEALGIIAELEARLRAFEDPAQEAHSEKQ